MISKSDAEAIIDKEIDEERLRKIIRNTSVVAWKKKISDSDVERWLTNFDGRYLSNVANERKLALWLLSHFTYYTYEDIRMLCKDLFNLFLHERLVQNKGNSLDLVLDEVINDTLFVGLGNDSESGKNLLYYFRQENLLSKKSFEYDSRKKYKNVVYLDDVSMSGSQAAQYVKSRIVDAENVYAGFLIATDKALEHLRGVGLNINPISTMILDDRDRAFTNSSYVFSDDKVSNICDIAREFCKIYGAISIEKCDDYMDSYPLGFADGQYLLGFEYNTPDNTLPIFWGTSNGWYPLFKRYQKIYGNGKESALDGRKYY